MVRERGYKRSHDGTVIQDEQAKYCSYSHFDKFCQLSIGLRRTMNEQARAIWSLISELDIVLWIECVESKCNIADPPSRMQPLPIRGIPVTEAWRLDVTSDLQ